MDSITDRICLITNILVSINFMVTPCVNNIQQFKLLKPNDIYIYIYIYMSYRSANLQMLHLKYLFNKYTY